MYKRRTAVYPEPYTTGLNFDFQLANVIFQKAKMEDSK